MGKKKNTDIVVVEPVVQSPAQVDSFIETALKANASPETMERLFALHEKVQANIARGAFTQALSDFQKACPEIKKNKKVLNKNGTLRYQYASLDSIGNQIKEPLSKNGLSYSWDVIKKENNMSVTVTITHVLGHKETSTLEIPIAVDQYMTEPQKYASAQTYAKRYTLINALGITTADEDDDATTAGIKPEKNPPSAKAQIMLALRRLGRETDDKIVIQEAVMSITGLELVENNYEEIIARLHVSIKEKEEYEKSESN